MTATSQLITKEPLSLKNQQASDFVFSYLTSDESKSTFKNGIVEIEYITSSIYIGEVNQDNEKDGKGIYKFSNEDMFAGNWQADHFQGEGKYFLHNGCIFQGIFENGYIIKGVLRYPNGNRYQGSFQNNQQSGWGKIMYNNRTVYEGNWKNGQKHGKGTFKSQNFIIQGEWERDILNGYCLLSGNNFEYNGIISKSELVKGRLKVQYGKNHRYEGEIYKGKRDGQGLYHFSENQFYKGQFLNDQFHGKGILQSYQGTYIGEFKNNLPQGKGEFIYLNGNRFEGSWRKGKKHGYGSFRYQMGHWHEGQYFEDERQGLGRYYWPQNNCAYQGQFVRGEMGRGRYMSMKL